MTLNDHRATSSRRGNHVHVAHAAAVTGCVIRLTLTATGGIGLGGSHGTAQVGSCPVVHGLQEAQAGEGASRAACSARIRPVGAAAAARSRARRGPTAAP